ncbi:hypothetical protein [Psychrobium sp. 1_MG-2023]|uniref:hypothetical protein n=1 Tax=Psychrobium sp. 1_MG-2023 TaxID=3062624 RepID=UPI000C34E76A|nr:hypothetical protein [Psychrobium sp. 1_MG-2023]MDP2559581.1 hypothetical protein [Psychrobium sp. 1_MG-2023]PKF59416.1 hypothetical protein CW748_01190 [Alteromonadales bacterium alter-6D02]
MKNFSLKTLVIACAATALIGCGDSETNITEITPTPAPAAGHDHDHDHGQELGKGRLAIADADQAVVHFFDLEDNSLVDSLSITNPAEYLYASPEGRYAVAVQRSFDTVEFIDGGVWQELHGDHYDQHNDEPELTSFTLNDTKPTHYVPRGDKAAVFFDGDKESGVNAGLGLLSDESIAEEKMIAEHHFDTYMHGTAEIRGEFVLTTLRDSESESSLPEQVALLEVHGDHFHQEQVFETTCPALHGSFQTETHIAFACGDGVLSIEQQGDLFTASKIANPTDMPEGVRIGSLKGSAESDVMFGASRAGFFLVDLAQQNITPFDWKQEETLTSVTYGFDGHNEHLLILDNEGHLNLYSAEENWQFDSRIEVFETLAEDAKPVIVASKAHELVYIINGQEVTTIDLHDGEVKGHFDLDFTPGKAAWLGVAAEEEHEH